jgi:hypothetical protein
MKEQTKAGDLLVLFLPRGEPYSSVCGIPVFCGAELN